jgi:TonB family protein
MMLVAGWLLHCVMVATVLSAGAIAWELAARWSGRPARWAWVAALAGSVVLPVLLRLLPERVLADAMPASMPLLLLDGLALQDATSASARISATNAALVIWVVASVAMLGYVCMMLLQLRRARRTWQQADVDGGRVWVTRGIGPAAVGVRGDVLVPRWALELDGDLRRLLLMHEREHVSAGDPRLLLGAIVLLALMPWNPVLWVQVLRLRNAIELDCDARVLRTGADPRTYGKLLLEVGRRRSANAFVMATFAEPRLFLEERIRRIARWPQPRRPLGAALLASLALILFVTAASARDPLRPTVALDGDVARDATMAVDTPPVAPAIVRYTKRPEILNPRDVAEAVIEAYPSILRDAGIGGTAWVQVMVDTGGAPARVVLSRPSGFPALDEAALAVARQLRFAPAQDGSARVSAWVEVPIVFAPAGGDDAIDRTPARVVPPRRGEPTAVAPTQRPTPGQAAPTLRPTPAGTPAAAAPTRVISPDGVDTVHSVSFPRDLPPPAPREPPSREELLAGPVFTPMTARPELLNRDAVSRALQESYPPLLRDAGISGSPTVHFLIDEDGVVLKTQLSRSSRYPAMDEAALAVARAMRFSPASNKDRKVPVWVEIPIQFNAK